MAMTINKTNLPSEGSPKTVTALVGAKTITAAYAYKHGVATVIELAFSDASTSFIKVANGNLEIGGTLEVGTGTKVNW
ncbi:hypothetical protein P8936_16470 [Edaphobacter paludis]|uniref:Uncharacterized protein n=1 Tax=Edaphobacter paludis TaxID=3035702 RepID=A0AAU7D8U6_9BACT